MTVSINNAEEFSFHETILRQRELISDKLNMLRHEQYPQTRERGSASSRWRRSRAFSVSRHPISRSCIWRGRADAHDVEIWTQELYRRANAPNCDSIWIGMAAADIKGYVPHRRSRSRYRVISVVNFKGGSSKRRPPHA